MEEGGSLVRGLVLAQAFQSMVRDGSCGELALMSFREEMIELFDIDAPALVEVRLAYRVFCIAKVPLA